MKAILLLAAALGAGTVGTAAVVLAPTGPAPLSIVLFARYSPGQPGTETPWRRTGAQNQPITPGRCTHCRLSHSTHSSKSA